jgi:acyl-CoA synthetase (AMP-forming)/AMP-acid ligase II
MPGMHTALERAADRFGERDFLLAGDEHWSFRELDERANAFARHVAGLGVTAGDRVAVQSSNRVEFVVAVNGISKLGAAAVLLSPAWKAAEVGHAVALTGPVHAVADGAGVELLGALLPVTGLDDEVADGDRSRLGIEVDDEAESVLVFSSGTTGGPKAVRHTHRSIGHGTRHWVDSLGLTADDRFQVATPPSHILGLLNLLAAAEAGATVRLHPRFDLDEVLRRIESDRITLEMAVAPIALAMADHPDLERHDLSSLRYVMWCATPVTEAVAHKVTDRVGVRWMTAYGASELPVITCNPVHEPDRWRIETVGVAPDGVQLRVVDLDTGAVLPSGEVGEVQVLSPSAMAGYLPDEATADAFTDGWYHTGDVGWIEADGWVHLTDRSKEMIKVNGFQVAPAELEAVLLGHPAVRDCAVFGLPDERAGEVPVAAVQLSAEVPVEELQALVADTLATYKQLRHVVVVDEVPRLPSGKALRRTLRDEWTPVLLGRA